MIFFNHQYGSTDYLADWSVRNEPSTTSGIDTILVDRN